jgi:hypothetical protein
LRVHFSLALSLSFSLYVDAAISPQQHLLDHCCRFPYPFSVVRLPSTSNAYYPSTLTRAHTPPDMCARTHVRPRSCFPTSVFFRYEARVRIDGQNFYRNYTHCIRNADITSNGLLPSVPDGRIARGWPEM